MSDVRARKPSSKTNGPPPARRQPDPLIRDELEAKIESLQQTMMLKRVLGMLGLMAVAWFGLRIFKQYHDGQFMPVVREHEAPVTSRWGNPNPSHLPKSMPAHLAADVAKRDEVKEAFQWSWAAYEKYAWGDDEFHPLSKSGSNLTSAGGVGYNIVDSLDSLLIMDLIPEYKRARDWCRDKLDFDKDAEFNTFETTIRILGGLLSAHYLTSVHSDPLIQQDAALYLNLAIDLADRLLGAFETPTGIPLSNINLAKRQGIPDMGNQGVASLSEAASLQLEMKYLSHLTGDSIYWKKAERVTQIIRSQATHDGIAPIFISPQSGQFVSSEIRLGSRGDSYYEYLLKQYLQTNREEPVYRDMYDEAMGGIKKHLLGQTSKSGIIFTQELHPARHPKSQDPTWQVVPKQDHLVCFLGGSFLLGITEGGRRPVNWQKLDTRDAEDFNVGRGIIEACMKTHETATGLAPEIAMFVQWSDEQRAKTMDWYIKPSQGGVLIDARNILRPETVESLMLGYRITGDPIYRQWGWQIFQAFQKHCRVATGYVGIEDVQVDPPVLLDKMETFWLGETLKYLYLLFDDSDHIPLSKNIFNTEAHILPVFSPVSLTPFSTS